jgi:cation:H+ antiporter
VNPIDSCRDNAAEALFSEFSMLIPVVLILISLILLVAGAEGLVRGSASLALRAGLSPLVIGLTIVACGTSAPELVVSVRAVLAGQVDLSIGNVVGSNSFNLGIILGLTALICPIPVDRQILQWDGPLALLAAVVLTGMVRDGQVSRLDAGILLAGMLGYLLLNLRQAGKTPEAAQSAGEEVPQQSAHVLLDLAYIVGGLIILVLGAQLLVDNSVLLAQQFGVSEAVIGLTIVAAGTSLPELATSLVAAIRKESDIAVGNVIGSNLFNILGILGVSGLIAPLQPSGMVGLDYFIMCGLTLLTLILAARHSRLSRLDGLLLLAGYAAYLYLRWPSPSAPGTVALLF